MSSAQVGRIITAGNLLLAARGIDIARGVRERAF